MTSRIPSRVAATLWVLLAACNAARAQEALGDAAWSVEGKMQSSAAYSSESMTTDPPSSLEILGTNLPHARPWVDFRQSVAGAAIPSCFAPDTPSHDRFAATGLLRLMPLVHAAADGACR